MVGGLWVCPPPQDEEAAMWDELADLGIGSTTDPDAALQLHPSNQGGGRR